MGNRNGGIHDHYRSIEADAGNKGQSDWKRRAVVFFLRTCCASLDWPLLLFAIAELCVSFSHCRRRIRASSCQWFSNYSMVIFNIYLISLFFWWSNFTTDDSSLSTITDWLVTTQASTWHYFEFIWARFSFIGTCFGIGVDSRFLHEILKWPCRTCR